MVASRSTRRLYSSSGRSSTSTGVTQAPDRHQEQPGTWRRARDHEPLRGSHTFRRPLCWHSAKREVDEGRNRAIASQLKLDLLTHVTLEGNERWCHEPEILHRPSRCSLPVGWIRLSPLPEIPVPEQRAQVSVLGSSSQPLRSTRPRSGQRALAAPHHAPPAGSGGANHVQTPRRPARRPPQGPFASGANDAPPPGL